MQKGVRLMEEDGFWRNIIEEQVMDAPLSGFRFSTFFPENRAGLFHEREAVKSKVIPHWWKY
jgi:hypothetical protein